MGDIHLGQRSIKSYAAENTKAVETDVQKSISPVSPFATDTIASAKIETEKKGAVANIKETLSSAVSWFYGLIYGQTPSSEQPNGGPVLEAPSIQEERTRQNFVKQMTEMQKRIASLDDEYKELLKGNSQNQEQLLMKLLVLAIKNQVNLKEQGELLSLTKVETHNKERLALNKDQQKINEELEAVNNRVTWAGRADTAAAVVAAGLTLVGVGAAGAAALGLAVPGFNIPAAAVLAAGVAKAGTIAAVAKAGTTLTNGYVKGESELKQKESYLVEAQKELLQEGIKIGYADLKMALEAVVALWTLLRETADRQQQTALDMFRK